jgi:cytosine/adenosine deaminase-related metal-dependent hydrolase
MFWQRRGITFVGARVLGPEGRVASSLRVWRGRVDALDVAPARRDVVVDAGGAVVAPGLINAHDHLELNSFRRLKWRERYDNAREWIAEFQPRFGSDPDLAEARPETLDERLWVGGLKNLLSGATTVCHHNPVYPALRRRFPVRIVRRMGISHSLFIDGPRVSEAYRRTPSTWPWIIHAAEGVDAEAAGEIERLDELGCLGANTVLVHGVAVCPVRARHLLSQGVALVWCPTSNGFLFGRTLDARAFDDGGRLAIGSDSRLSGEGDLLDEMRAAYATRQISAEGVVRSATSGAADVLRLPDAGRLAPGSRADIVMVRAAAADPYESVVRARRTDIQLVLQGGDVALADPVLAARFDGSGALVAARVDGRPRRIARWMARRVRQMRLCEPGLEVEPC